MYESSDVFTTIIICFSQLWVVFDLLMISSIKLNQLDQGGYRLYVCIVCLSVIKVTQKRYRRTFTKPAVIDDHWNISLMEGIDGIL